MSRAPDDDAEVQADGDGLWPILHAISLFEEVPADLLTPEQAAQLARERVDRVLLHSTYPTLITPDGFYIRVEHAASSQDERERARAEEKQVTSDNELKAKAAAFAKTCDDALSLEEHIQAAAPVPHRRRASKQRNASPYSWILPSIVPERHGAALAWRHGDGNFFAHMAAHGIGQGLAQDIKLEITTARLLNGEDVEWNAVSDRERRPADDNIIVGSLLRFFWRAHDQAISLAQRQGLQRDHTITYRPGKPAMVAEVFARLSDMKEAGNRVSARAALLAIDAVAQAFRREVLTQ